MGSKRWIGLLLSFLVISGLSMNLFTGPVDAIPGVDEDLNRSYASFLGEKGADAAGNSVTFLGDVNGDSIDDLMIGAFYNDEEVSNGGQAYLFFGKEHGWSMNTALSKADASFVGMSQDDYCGLKVRDAGDVNGDGLDDILISQVGFTGREPWCGITRLFFGKTAGWAMDTPVTQADVSFWGEKRSDGAAFGIDGAGDINRDGFDDIVIGALGNDEGAAEAGKIYIILGKAQGWSHRFDLEDADASFIGYIKHDCLGRDVAGVGDVNADGYDDILVGAPGSSHGNFTPNIGSPGRAYLILGKGSGWTLDENISSADVTFLGENGYDEAGICVGGAGDVNADGYDDILIGAQYNDDGGVDAGQAYLVLGKATGWSNETNLSKADASFWGEKAGDGAGWSVAGAGDVNADGYDDILIGSWNFEDWSADEGQAYLVLGKAWGWSMDTDLSRADATFWGEDNGDMAGYAVAGGGDVNNDTYDDMLISAPSYEEDGTEEGVVYLVMYDDGASPVIEEDLTPGEATTGDDLTFTVNVSDNRGIHNVTIEYWYGENQTRSFATASLASGDQLHAIWQTDTTIPSESTETLHYIIHLRDKVYRMTSSVRRDVMVVDNDPPSLSDLTSGTATTGDLLSFLTRATDNINLTDVNVEYWFGEGAHENISMVKVGVDTWRHTIDVPSDTLESIHYIFHGLDNSSNFATTPVGEIIVSDNDPPSLLADNTNETATTGDPFTFLIEASDNIAIGRIKVNYWYGNSATQYLYLNNVVDGRWEGTIPIDNTVEDMQYTFTIIDTHGNERLSAPRKVTIVDNDPPEVIEDLSDTVATTGDPYMARVRVYDNIGVDLVAHGSRDLWTAVNVDEHGNGVYEQEFQIPSDYVGPYIIGVRLLDTSGNEVTVQLNALDVMDNDPPELRDFLTNRTAIKGMTFLFYVKVVENVIPPNMPVYVEYRIGEGPLMNETMERVVVGDEIGCNHHITIPRASEGMLFYRYGAVDRADNWNWTEEIIAPLANVVPVFSDLPTWNVTESTDAEFDLTTYINDHNDDAFTIECLDDNITVEGLVLKLRHDTAVPGYTVKLTISDGESESDTNLTIHVVNVNDPPFIIDRQPPTETKFREGKRVTLSVMTEDEDGDPILVTWWDGEEELGNGSILEVKLKPGEHVITVVVSDGTDQLEDTFTVIVKKEEESPGFGLFAVLTAVLLACFLYRKRQ